MYHSRTDLDALPARVRAALVNSLTGFKSANVIGTRDSAGRFNLAMVSSAFHLGSAPPLLGLIFRPQGDRERHSLDNLLATGEFTLNHVHRRWFERAHQTAARYPREQSEFEAVGLTPELAGELRAPYVAEAEIRLGLKLAEHQRLAINNTELVIGELVALWLPKRYLRDDGSVDLNAAGTVAVSGLDSYHSPHLLARLSYAVPDSWPSVIED